MKTLMITTRPLTSSVNNALMYGLVDDNTRILLVHCHKNEYKKSIKRHEILNKELGVNYDKFHLFNARSYSTLKLKFSELVDLINVDEFKEYDTIRFFDGIQLSGINNKKPLDYNQRVNMNIGVSFNQLFNTAICIAIHKKFNTKVVQYTTDPQEMQLNQLKIPTIVEKANFGHNYKNQKYNDFYQKSMEKKRKLIPKVEKDLEFVMGYTELKELSRNNTVSKINEVIRYNFKNIKIFTRNDSIGINTLIRHNEYLSYLNRSKFTLVIPPYDKESFSVYRLIESLAFDCLPLIHNSCCLKYMNETYNCDFSELIYNDDFDLSDENRLYLLEKFKSFVFYNRPTC